MPQVSVIIPAYNKANLTVQTVKSVLNQTFKDIEIIVVDDGSVDDTSEKLSQFGDRIIYVYQKNKGACGARNTGIRYAQGNYLAFLDCDDLYESDKLELSVNALKQNEAIGFVYSAAFLIDNDNKTLRIYQTKQYKNIEQIFDKLLLGNFICNSTVVVRKEVIDKAGLFDETIFMPADWDMWLRFSEISKGKYLDKPLTHYRVSNNYVFRNLDKAFVEERCVLEKILKNIHDSKLIRSAWGRFYIRFAQCYFLKKDSIKFSEYLVKAKEHLPFSLRPPLLKCGSKFFPNLLYKKLFKRILIDESA